MAHSVPAWRGAAAVVASASLLALLALLVLAHATAAVRPAAPGFDGVRLAGLLLLGALLWTGLLLQSFGAVPAPPPSAAPPPSRRPSR
ncbi:hypothetical protein [Streptomyces europaeiscabiei]|uniref:hypothetical protein n=1 Tax=Streptomyces europaeiscabiei TaxID=146819 RepID=UPI002E29AE49|nr:hypothetical protein [Streptomyces europaeiscabiei]